MGHADYRKNNDHSLNSSTYHKKDGTNVRAQLRENVRKSLEFYNPSYDGTHDLNEVPEEDFYVQVSKHLEEQEHHGD